MQPPQADIHPPIEFISHPLIKPNSIERRLYQLSLAGCALGESTLIVLPTGLGKTIIALLAIARRLQEYQGTVIILSPTKPLVEQHATFLRTVMNLPSEEIIVLTGSISPQKRSSMIKDARIIVSTPQVVENDLRAGRIDLSDIVHITFDEAHRAVGNYAYVYIARQYQLQCKDPLILGITASPGSNSDKIEEVCSNLFVSKVQVRTETDPDVKPYIHYRELEWRHIKVPVEIGGLKRSMELVLENRMHQLAELGFVDPARKYLNKREMLDLQAQLQGRLSRGPDQRIYKAISLVAELFKVDHAIEIAGTQGPEALAKYFDRLEHEASSRSGSKASRRLMDDVNMRHAIYSLKEMDISHPKLETVKEIVSDQLLQNPESRVIVFTNYRDTSELVTERLKEVDNIRPVRFVGQASKYKDTGLTQKQQVDILNEFKSGKYNTLVATSVAEEGLDIPATDLVLFFEPVPSEIRSIQRKGRTGRKHAGKVVVLVAKGTKDEAYYWSSRRKENTMNDKMRQFKSPALSSTGRNPDTNFVEDDRVVEDAPDTSGTTTPQKQLLDYSSSQIQIYVDRREIRSGVAQALEDAGDKVIYSTLNVGDYIISDKVAIERKTDMDLLDSIIDKNRNLFRQLSDLTKAYDRPVLIIEGDNLYTGRQIHPNAIRGVLSSIATDFGIPIINSKDEVDTAAFIHIMAKREQEDKKRSISLHGSKTSMTLKEQQEYIVSAISNIGPTTAIKLLRHFGSVEHIISADIESLLEVDSVGPKTAQYIIDVVKTEYKG
ncbi:MAG: DEAD/DEAH box helicase [Euryarchaeota archaeon]|nr:DEAD/DEAH box helicase [Euryarchaeota archaeon]